MNLLAPIFALSLPIIVIGLLAWVIKIKSISFKHILAFSASYLFSLTIMHLLPEVYGQSNFKLSGLFIVVGFSLQLLLENISSGLEHGHSHHHQADCKHSFPIGIIAGLFIHSFLEGLPIYHHQISGLEESYISGDARYQLLLGLIIHNIPISFLFVTLLKEHHQSIVKSLILLIAFSLMAPLGYTVSYFIHKLTVLNVTDYQYITDALVIGIFLYISTAIVFETGDEHKYSFSKILIMIFGVVAAYLLS
ncbi:MAG: ZIP family metal transporter [Bacteroidia bacterium]